LSRREVTREAMATGDVNRIVANELWVELCAAKGTCWLKVLTGSMMPLLRPGDLVKVSRIVPQQAGFSDIVVFRRGQDLIIHRVLKKHVTPDGLYFSEKGDAGYVYGQVSADNIVGRVIGLKKGTRVLDLSSSPSRLANLFISAWLKLAAAVINRLKSSKNPFISGTGTVLHYPLKLTSGFLVIVCSVIWYPAGILVK
jgi:signal peptidase I